MSTPLRLTAGMTVRAVALLGAAGLLLALLPGAAHAQAPELQDPEPLTSACPADAVPPADFDDVPADSQFAADIACLAWYGITQGRTATSYDRLSNVTRAQMASFFVRLIHYGALNGLPELPEAGEEPPFTDLTSDKVSAQQADDINRLAAAGIVQGAPGGLPETSYGPDLAVTRAQMASFINRVQGFLEGDDLDGEDYGFEVEDDAGAGGAGAGALQFPDVGENTEPHTRNIQAISAVGISKGRAGGIYDPGAATSREQMAGFIMRHVDVNVQLGNVLAFSDMPRLTDIAPASGSPGTEVAITGENLGDDESAISVFFGSTEATDVSLTDGTLAVEVPTPGEEDRGAATVMVTATVGELGSVNALAFEYDAPTVERVDVLDEGDPGVLDDDDLVVVTFSEGVEGADAVAYTFIDGDGNSIVHDCAEPDADCSVSGTTTLTVEFVLDLPDGATGLVLESAALSSVSDGATSADTGVPLELTEAVPVTPVL